MGAPLSPPISNTVEDRHLAVHPAAIIRLRNDDAASNPHRATESRSPPRYDPRHPTRPGRAPRASFRGRLRTRERDGKKKKKKVRIPLPATSAGTSSSAAPPESLYSSADPARQTRLCKDRLMLYPSRAVVSEPGTAEPQGPGRLHDSFCSAGHAGHLSGRQQSHDPDADDAPTIRGWRH